MRLPQTQAARKKRKCLKKRVKVAIPKISDFRTFLDSKLKVNIPELKKDTNLSEPVPLELVKDQSDQIETKVPLLHQNLIGIKSITYSYK